MNDRVLVVEDSPTQALLVREDLEGAGYRVTVAGTAEEALAWLREGGAADLVLSDVVMPGMDGFELCCEIKAAPDMAALPLVLITSLTDPLEVVRGLEAGADGFLRKPYQLDHLVARIESVLSNRRLGAGADPDAAVEVSFLGRRFLITSDRRQILNLLVSTFQDLVLANRELEARERQLKEAHDELEAAHRRALEATRHKSQFLAAMSHEIRNPMNGVVGMAALLLDTELSAEQREYAETIRHSADALLAVINDILDFSKVEAGKLELESVEFDLRAVVEEATVVLAGAAQGKDVELVCLVHPDVPRTVCGDPGRLRQVLVNLVSNAVKFTEEGEVAVRVGVEEGRADAVVLRCEVADTGIGIAPEHRARLFESFVQGGAATQRTFGGTGLGLAICKQLTELMGGAIDVVSEAGRGSTFWFTAELGRGSDPAGAAPFRDPRLRGLRVLVVDDSAAARSVLETHLTSWGAHPTSARSPSEALTVLSAAAARGERFDLALVDARMRGGDGFELVRAIRDDPWLAPLPVVLLTSLGHHGEAREAGRKGFAGTLTKPVREASLFECLSAVVGGGPPEEGGDATAPKRQAGAGSVAEPEAGAGRRLLVAEDNPVNQKVAALLLAKQGFLVDIAGNGREAVELVSKNEYAAVLMDCQMPEMDGFEATAAIRRREAGGARLPIIAMTADAMEGTAQRCLAAGMDDFTTKPVKIAELSKILARWAGPDGGGAGSD